MSTLTPLPLPAGVSEAYLDCTSTCNLTFHILQAGSPRNNSPLVLFCHGYPELAFSWRNILPAVAHAGFYCVAMDMRGSGRTTSATTSPQDLTEYTLSNLVRDLVCLVYKLGYTSAACIVGHDFGAVASATAALLRPDMFQSTIQMSHPYHAPAAPQFGDEPLKPVYDMQAELAKLEPPRKHYKWYNSGPEAAAHWDHPPQGLESFLGGIFI